jgi:hypothetical protein
MMLRRRLIVHKRLVGDELLIHDPTHVTGGERGFRMSYIVGHARGRERFRAEWLPGGVVLQSWPSRGSFRLYAFWTRPHNSMDRHCWAGWWVLVVFLGLGLVLFVFLFCVVFFVVFFVLFRAHFLARFIDVSQRYIPLLQRPDGAKADATKRARVSVVQPVPYARLAKLHVHAR